MKAFTRELKRRKVYQVGAVYIVVGYAVAEGAQYLFELAGLPVVASRAVAIVLLLGLPVALVLAWAYELRPEETSSGGQAAPRPGVPWTDEDRSSDHRASIVVLPFDNISPDPSDAYFADGLTEEITASLCGVRDLRVTSRNSATVFKRAGKGTQAIGAELGVAYVLEGSVRKAGDALRVTAQLIRTETDEHLWSERYDGALSDVFGVQEEVARSIVRTLELHLRPEEARRLAARPMDDIRAYESYLKAREASLKWTPEALEHALEHLEQAHARIGENAVVLAGIGYVYSQFSNIGADDRDYVALAEEYARRALKLDPDNPEAHMVLGFLFQEGLQDVDRSLHHLERSLAVKPDDPHTLTWWAIALSLAGRNEEMMAAATRLVEVDPLNPLSRSLLGLARQVGGDLKGGLEDMEVSYRGSPEGSAESFFYAHALAMVGRGEDALAILRREFASDSPVPFLSVAPLLRAALEDAPERMHGVMTESFRAKVARDLQLCFYTTQIYALAGLREQTREWLRHMVAGGFRNYPWLTHDPWLTQYRDDPPFRAMFEEVREAWERNAGNGIADAKP
jgi:serine/threonine-protein kinase